MPRSIASRLFLSYLAVVVVGLAVASITISGLLLRYEDDQTRLHLQELSAPFLTAIQTGVRAGQPPRDIVDALTEQAHAANARLLLTTAQRRVVIDSEGTLAGTLLPQPTTGNIGEFTEGNEQWIWVRQLLARAAGSGVGLGFIVVARPITRPLRDLVGGVRRFAGGDYGTRVPLAGPSEVAEMGTAFNEMASEIQRSRGSEQAFLADISHELRTPLTSIQGFAQAIVEREARRLVRMGEGLLQVARLESGAQSMAREDVAPARLLESAVAALEVQAKDAGVTFEVVGTDALPSLSGDPDKLAQLFLNVLDNAVKHSPRGTTVHIRGNRDNGAIVVRVRDAGSGLPQGAQTRLFQRFYRGDNAQRDGAGLGLAIAQAIAQAHGGSIRASNVDGGGAEFAVRLPVAKNNL